ncbi:outer membrane beta-barrel protein [Brucella sp. IR073]|uniref:outer membrane beta-barrel protein n=1 Tax=unclassified Brucella TaxID=2632610 RepID=UPI003B986678
MHHAASPAGSHLPIASKRRFAALLLAGVALSAFNHSALAQETPLRGSLQEAAPPPVPYQPASAGAVPDADTPDNGGYAVSVDENTLQGLPIEPEGLPGAPQAEENTNRRPARADDEAQPTNLRTGPVGGEDMGDTGRIARDNQREPPIDGHPRTRTEADPFDPEGIRAGSFILRPSIEQGIRATSNADNSSDGKSAILSETALQLGVRSDWSRHQATIDASGNIVKTLSGQKVDEPRIDIESGLRLDLNDATKVNIGAGYHLRRESASNPSGIVGALKRPIVQTLNGSLGVERDVGVFFGAATARVERSVYGDAEISGGGKVTQKDRDANLVTLTLRGGYEISEAIKPFAEIEAGKRIYDQKRDDNGYERDATRLGLRVGSIVDMGEKLNGEFSVGYLRENIEDERLKDIGGLWVNAAMNWSPERGTDVRISGQTIVDGGTAPGDSGNILYLANIDVKRLIRANLTFETGLDLTLRDNRDGTSLDYGLGAEIGATYWFNRFVGVNGRLRHEFMKSDVSWREYTANSVYVGVKVQR